MVTEVAVSKPFSGSALDSLVLGMNFTEALESCAKEFTLDEVKKNSRVYKLDQSNLKLQIFKENSKLSFLKIFTA